MIYIFFLFVLKTQINFCEQSISRDTKIIKCNKQVLRSEFQKLKYFKELRFIDLNSSSFHDICLLNSLENLEAISLKNTDINNLKCLNKMKNISYLNLQDTKIENFKNILSKNLLILELNKIDKTDINFLSSKIIKPIIIILKNIRPNSPALYKISKNKYSILPISIINERKIKLINTLIKLKFKYYISPFLILKEKKIFYLIENIKIKSYYYLLEFLIKNNLWLIYKLDANNKNILDYLELKINSNNLLIQNKLLELREFIINNGGITGREIINIKEIYKKIISMIKYLYNRR